MQHLPANPVWRMRPIREADLPALVELLATLTSPLTSLPPDEKALAERIHLSQRSFYPQVNQPGPEQYFFVLEEAATGQVVGTSAIIAQVGGYDPFYTYEIRREEVRHSPLALDYAIDVLHLHRIHKGPTEIGTLFLHPAYRRAGIGRLLSLSRFLFLRQFPQRFTSSVIAELRGYLNEAGQSPFWEAVGRHFFQHEFDQADYLSGLGQKDFIRDLMPQYPIYVPMLPREVQAAIGQVHRETVPARRLLEQEGFRFAQQVDIFDAGPLLRCPTQDIRCLREARQGTITALAEAPVPDSRPLAMVARPALDFRATLAPVDPVKAAADGVTLTPSTAEALGLQVGDAVLWSPLHASSRPTTT